MARKYDPYGDIKTVHRGGKVNQDGDVSALCWKRPRAMDLSKCTWTIVESQVTCGRCKAILRDVRQGGRDPGVR